MSYAAVVNLNSGYVMAKSADFVRGMLQNAAGGALDSLEMVEGPAMDTALRAAFAREPKAVIVLGGDGAARAAAEYAHQSDAPVILLPGGTMNLLSRQIYGDCEPDECLRLAMRCGMRRLDAGRANGRLFLLQGLFGSAPDIARAREAVRAAEGLEDIPAVLAEAQTALAGALGHSLTYRVDGGEELHAESLAISIGSLDHVISPSQDAGRRSFEIIGVDPNGFLEVVRLGMGVLMQRWRDDPAVEVARGCALDLHLDPEDPCGVLDGEPIELSTEVRVEYAPEAVPVMAPPPGSRAVAA